MTPEEFERYRSSVEKTNFTPEELQKKIQEFREKTAGGRASLEDIDDFLDEEFNLYLQLTGDPLRAFRKIRQLRIEPLEAHNDGLLKDLKNLIQVVKRYKNRGQGRTKKSKTDSEDELLIIHEFLRESRLKEQGWKAFENWCERQQKFDYKVPFKESKFYDLKKLALTKDIPL